VAITYAGAQFLVNARQGGVSFERTLTLGRQDLSISPFLLTRLLKRAGLIADPASFRRDITTWPYRADRFFKALGASQLSFLDNSPYEGADLIHDLNKPLPQELHDAYDLVVDSGTLEHVFNFPVALKSTLELVKVGGHVVFMTPTNNSPGHGFYQFSPELFYQAVGEANGYRIKRMLAIEDQLAKRYIFGRIPVALESQRGAYDIPKPTESGAFDARVEFTTTRPTHLFVLAVREQHAPIFARAPQQALYRARWEGGKHAGDRSSPVFGPVGRPLNPHTPAGRAGLGAALHIAFGGLGRRLGPIRNLAVAWHYRALRLQKRKRGVRRSEEIHI
jgi:SAM-dependent methyltransferase